MNTIYSFSPDTFARPLAIATLVAVCFLVVRGLLSRHLVRIGLRNVPRRKLRAGLIVFGLMLATTFVAASFAVDDTIVQAVKSVAVFNLGRVDEQVIGNGSPLGIYSAATGQDVKALLRGDPRVAGVAPALVVPDVLAADETAREVRGSVIVTGLDPSAAGPLGSLTAVGTGAAQPPASLAADDVYLNRSLGQLLNAHVGDSMYLYSTHWAGHRYLMHVRGIATGGLLGDAPAMVVSLPTLQSILGTPNAINHIYVANTGDGLSGVPLSDPIHETIQRALPDNLHVQDVKQQGVQFALQAQDIFGRILLLFTLFALAIGLLLIFLIFTLLAAERRAELGMARAIGMRRMYVVWVLLFEGSAYDAAAAALGMLAGLALGVIIVAVVSPTIAKLGFPLSIAIKPTSMLVAFCTGALFTLATVALAAATVTRMTIVAALRDLPEPPAPAPSLLQLVGAALSASTHVVVAPGRAVAAWLALIWGACVRGLVPLIVGLRLLQLALAHGNTLLFSVGLSIAVAGAVLCLRWLTIAAIVLAARLAVRRTPGSVAWLAARATITADRICALLIGGGLALYWSLPFDALAAWGLPRFSGGIQVFFIAGTMMVFGTVFAIAPNLDLLLLPVRWLAVRLGRIRHVAAIALVYPAHQRFRTGIGLALFTMVCFTMVVMASIASSATQTYDDIPAQASGYDIAGQALFAPVGGIAQLQSTLQSQAPSTEAALAAVSTAQPVPLGVIQPGASHAGWRLYPADEIQGAFLQGVGLPLVARASGYATDAAVWQAVRTQPGAVVIDAAALSSADAAALGAIRPGSPSAQHYLGPPIAAGLSQFSTLSASDAAGFSGASSAELGAIVSDPDVLQEFTLRLRGIVSGSGTITPTPLWVSDLRGGSATRLTVVGIVDNAHGQRYGLYGSPQTFAPAERGLPTFGRPYYYFKMQPGDDARTASLSIGSALIDHGFETTVIQDVLLDVNGPRVFISRVLVGLVGLTLLVGMAALAVTGSRAVVERRQQIGMLRALGFRRWHVQLLFLIEALLVGALGTGLGLALGLVLCRNVFAVDFFAQFSTGLRFVVPWGELIAICAAALVASLLASLLPAWQAGRVAPADALRYE